MDFSNYNIGYGITGSFCTFSKARKAVEHLKELGANVVPIFSFNAQTCDTRFGSAKEFVDGICTITGNEGIRTITQAEPIGPNSLLDIMVIAPCTDEPQLQFYYCAGEGADTGIGALVSRPVSVPDERPGAVLHPSSTASSVQSCHSKAIFHPPFLISSQQAATVQLEISL